jgi:hypothetical protein
MPFRLLLPHHPHSMYAETRREEHGVFKLRLRHNGHQDSMYAAKHASQPQQQQH